MAKKRMTLAELIEQLTLDSGLTEAQVKSVLHAQAKLLYENVDRGFPIPGVGVFERRETPARQMVMPFGPRKGQEVSIPAKRRIMFHSSQIAKQMVLGAPQSMPDIFHVPNVSDFKFSSAATLLEDPSIFIADLGPSLTLARDNTSASLVVYRLPDLWIPSGRVLASDILIVGGQPFRRDVVPGRYPLGLAVAQLGTAERIAFSIMRFSDARVAKWELALLEEDEFAVTKPRKNTGYGVDSGTGCFCDASVKELVEQANEADIGFFEQVTAEMKDAYKHTRQWVHIDSPQGSLALFSSGYGDGYYESYFGLDEAGNPAILLTDFNVVKWTREL